MEATARDLQTNLSGNRTRLSNLWHYLQREVRILHEVLHFTIHGRLRVSRHRQ